MPSRKVSTGFMGICLVTLLNLQTAIAVEKESSCQLRFSAVGPEAISTSGKDDVNGTLLATIKGQNPGDSLMSATQGKVFTNGRDQDLIKKKYPEEFSECKDDEATKTAVWYEFLRGLAKIESDGKCSGVHGDAGHFGGKGSDGLFQMTKGDHCGGKGNETDSGTLKDPNDFRENIACAVGTWSKIMDKEGKIIGNPYWGPCKRGEDICKKIIEKVKSQICSGGFADPRPDSIDWTKELGGGGSSGSSGSSGRIAQ